MGVSSRYRSGKVAILTVIVMESICRKIQNRTVELSIEELSTIDYFCCDLSEAFLYKEIEFGVLDVEEQSFIIS